MQAETTFSLKDQLFNPAKVDYLATLISEVHTEFPKATFSHDVVSAFPELELKERIAHIAACLQTHLPSEYPVALDILLRSLPPELDPTKTDDDFGDFIFAPLSHFVAIYGCTPEHLDLSLNALRTITKRFSAEDAIRYFINEFPVETMDVVNEWASDTNYHVRRLASEGTRPKLPWAQKLTIGYHEPLPILDKLYTDPTRYVTRSVANHLNDISKLEPDLVINILDRWQKSKAQGEKEMAFILQHSLRTLVKQGDRAALKLLGFGGKPDIGITDFATSTSEVVIGNAFEFSLTIRSNKKQKLVVDYLMEFATEPGKKMKKRPQKIFKLKQLDLEKGQVVNIKKKHPMKLMTTRRLFAGEHRISLQVNGEPFGKLSFELVEA
ncbi:MAG: DNA alkylation repair protein [Chloroflexota bacterium]